MRHLIGVVLALVVCVALFFGVGWGLAHMSASAGHSDPLASVQGLLAFAAVLATGIFAGVLMAAPPVSPLAAGLPGLGLLAWSTLIAVKPHLAVGWMPFAGLSVVSGFKAVLGSGTLALIGAAMTVPLFVPSRWRRAEADDDGDAEPALPAATGMLS